ncbi:hypothetical protein [Halocalculus aciditolerans]|uniref:Uncharacterized protein n=1 Tax=Halocalculus aciditolerans TaxID=1383812 RepID=A0A830FFF4_9EURY|nr:hypothetical protein [Halocalculus aciditolerans]GGL70199.1 hypothetical protein GCM10009039_30300 [Halocalculus aciditolerans]
MSDSEKSADVVELSQEQIDDLANGGTAWISTDKRFLALAHEDRFSQVLDEVADAASEDEVVLERIREKSGEVNEA